MKRNVALFFGGKSMENEISVITAMQALAAMDKSKYKVEPVYMLDGNMYAGGVDKISAFKQFDGSAHTKLYMLAGALYEIKRGKLKRYFRPDVALICCHGGDGEGGVLQAMLEYNGIKYTSCSPLTSALLLDKATSKLAFEALLINVLPHEEVEKGEFLANPEGALIRIEEALGYPVIVKPNRLGSSIGISGAHTRDELNGALELAFEFDDIAVVETMLSNFVEVNCAAVRDGDRIIVSDTERPVSSNEFLTFDDKYAPSERVERIIPADIGATELIVKAITERVYRELRLSGVVRIDFLLDEGKKVYLNEINTVPGSLAYYLFKGVGISRGELLDILIENASLKEYDLPRSLRTNILNNFGGGGKLEGKGKFSGGKL